MLGTEKLVAFGATTDGRRGWQVADIAQVVASLAASNVSTERYAGLDQDAAGVWRAPSGARVAWFKDPDGNLLSVAQYPAGHAA